MKKVEDSFAGNICRCTGYRPILDAFKSYAKDAPSDETNNILDIEDLSHLDLCKRKTRNDSEEDIVTDEGFCLVNVDKNVCLKADNVHWYKVYTIKDIFDLFQTHSTDSYTLIAGNTGQGTER